MDDLLSCDQVAETLQVHPKTVGRLISSGQLAAVRLGRLTRVDPRDLAAFIESRKKRATS